jgi:hypothetical protein
MKILLLPDDKMPVNPCEKCPIKRKDKNSNLLVCSIGCIDLQRHIGQQSILAQCKDLDLIKFDKWCSELPYTVKAFNPISHLLKRWITEQFIQEQNSSDNSNSSQEGKDGR